MIAVDLLSEIFILIVLGIYLKRNNVIDGHTVDQLMSSKNENVSKKVKH